MKTVLVIERTLSSLGLLGLAGLAGFWEYPLFHLGFLSFLSYVSFFRFFKVNLRKENATILKKNAPILMAALVPIFLTSVTVLGSTMPYLSFLGFVGYLGYILDKRCADE